LNSTFKNVYRIYKDRCPECGNQELIIDANNGEIFCVKCGLVLKENMLAMNPEWRAYTSEDKRQMERVGLPITLTLHDMGLQTIFYTNRDRYGKILSKKTRTMMMRLKRWQKISSIKEYPNRNLNKAMTELKRISDRLNLPKHIQREAALIYRKTLKMGMLRGRAIMEMIAASTHLACRINRISRKLSEVVTASGRDRKRIARYYRKIIINLDMKIPPDDPVKYISKIANMLKIDAKTQNRAIKLLNKAKGYPLLGKDPSGLAAALLYIACIENGNCQKKTQIELAKTAGVTDVTVRNRYRQLMKVIKPSFNPPN
jgi:transcription initiation factor TFIIB